MVRLGRPTAALSTVAALLVAGMALAPSPAEGLGASAPPTGSVSASAAGDAITSARLRATESAKVTGQKVPVEEMTTETTKVWALPDGTYESNIASGPVRLKRDGRWTEVDLTLRKRADGSIAPVAHLDDLVLAGGKADGESTLAALGSGSKRRGMHWTGRLPEPVLSGQTATYKNVYPGVDLVVEARMTGYEQFIVIRNRAGLAYAEQAQAALRLGEGAEATPDGGLKYTDEGGQVTGRTVTPLMWDAAVDPLTGEPKNVRKVELTARGTAFGLSADANWLKDSARTFPITIDPEDTNQWTAGDTYVDSNTPSTKYWTSSDMGIGTTNGGAQKRIAYVNVSAAGMAYATIHSARLGVYVKTAPSGVGCPAGGVWKIFGTQSNADANTNWTYRPSLITAEGYYIGQNGNGDEGNYAYTPFGSNDGGSGDCLNQWIGSTITGLFQYAADRAWGQFTAAITPYWDNTNAYYRRFWQYDSGKFYPNATVNWSWKPTLNVPTRATTPATTCVEGSGRPTIPTAQPTLSAAFDQNEGLGVDVHFEYGEVGGSTTTVRYLSVGAGVTANYQIPAGELVDGKSYRWKTYAKSAKGVWSDHTGWCEFTVDVWAPPVAGCPGTATEKADFNGDGYVDKAIGDPLKATGGLWESGAVTIVNGQTGALTTLDQNLPAVPDTAEAGDRFGSSLAVVDVNRDGCADLAIGTPYEDLTVADAGQVDVLYGAPAGLGTGPAAETFSQGTNRVPGTQNAYDWFGYSLAAGQTSGNEAYILIGTPGDDLTGGNDAGSATYIRGEYRIAMDQSLVSGQVNEIDDRFGTAVAATGNQLAISMPGESLTTDNQFAGRVCTFKHTITSNRLDLIMCFSQADFGVNGFEAGDEFGKSLSMAPYRSAAGGPIDSILAVGVPGEDNAGLDEVGVVHFYKVTTTAVSLLSTNWKTGGQTGDRFGEKVLVVNLDPNAVVTDAKVIAAVGAPGRDASGTVLDSGEIRVFPAGKTGTLSYDVSVTPGPATARTLLGVGVGGNGTHLFAPSVYQGTKSVYALKWADLAAGAATVDTAATVAAPTGSIAFGAQVG